MPAPLPPVVDGPIYAVPNVQIYVDNVLPNALVKLLENGSDVGHATSSEPGGIWVTATTALTAGKNITATQTYNGTASYIDATPGVESAPSNVAIPVVSIPQKLPVPTFISGISQCSNSVWLGNLIQGCKVTISQNGNALATGLVTQPTQWFTLNATPLAVGTAVEAIQEYEKIVSPIGKSLLVFAASDSLAEPVIGTPVRDCQTFLDLSNLTPGANITVGNAGNNSSGTSPWPAFTAVDLPPMQTGNVTAQQYYTRCSNVPKSPVATEPVTNKPVPLPQVTYPLCSQIKQFTVTDLVAGEVLTLKRVVTPSAGAPTVTDIGSQGISSSTATVNLPPSFSPSAPNGTVSLRLSVTLCGLEASTPPYVSIAFSTAGGPFPPPTLQQPIYACSTFVTVEGAHPGSLITIFAGTATNLLCNPIVATSANFAVALWNPLVEGQQISVVQSGCNAGGTTKPANVQALPERLQAPTIDGPVLAGDGLVSVSNVIPGAQIVLYVDNVFRSQVQATGTSASLPVYAPALTDGEHVETTQAICTLTSAISSAQVYAPVPPPPQGLISNFNYFLAAGGPVLTGVTATVAFSTAFSSSANGYSFQFNCYSEEGATITTEWQQYVIYASPGSTQLWARIDTWNGTAKTDELNRIDQTLAVLPSATIPINYSFIMALTYTSGNTGTVTGCIYTVKDENQNVVGTTQITIIPHLLRTTGLAATSANLAPIVACTYNIGGDYGGNTATFATGAGTITIQANQSLSVLSTEPLTYTVFNDGTAENGNLTFGSLIDESSTEITQTFQVTTGGEPRMMRSVEPGRHVLGPPDNLSMGRHVLGAPDDLSHTEPEE